MAEPTGYEPSFLLPGKFKGIHAGDVSSPEAFWFIRVQMPWCSGVDTTRSVSPRPSLPDSSTATPYFLFTSFVLPARANIFVAGVLADILDSAVDAVPCPSTGVVIDIKFNARVVPTLYPPGSDETAISLSADDLESNPTTFELLLDTCDFPDGEAVVASVTYTDDQGNAPDMSAIEESGVVPECGEQGVAYWICLFEDPSEWSDFVGKMLCAAGGVVTWPLVYRHARVDVRSTFFRGATRPRTVCCLRPRAF